MWIVAAPSSQTSVFPAHPQPSGVVGIVSGWRRDLSVSRIKVTRPERGLQLRKKGLKGFNRYFGLNESTGLLLAYGMEHRADRL